MSKSSLRKTTTIRKKNDSIQPALFNSKNYGNKSLDIPIDDVDTLVNNKNICDMLGIKSSLKTSTNLNDSNNSILTDLDGLENEQSLLDDLLYGGGTGDDHISNNKKHNTSSTSTNNKTHSHGKPPRGRSRSPSITGVNGLSNRPRSNDSDSTSRVSFDMPNSDVDDSGHGRIQFV
jgi:hypothetical protein